MNTGIMSGKYATRYDCTVPGARSQPTPPFFWLLSATLAADVPVGRGTVVGWKEGWGKVMVGRASGAICILSNPSVLCHRG